METKRQQKVGRLIQRDLAGIFQKSGKTLFGNAMITVTKVNLTRDLSIARAYVSLFTTDDKSELLEKIRMHSREIRKELGTKIRYQMRAVPELEFYEDDSLDYIDNIDRLLKDD